MMCLTLILVCSMSISAFAVDHVGRAENGTTQSVQMTDNQKGEAATKQKSSEAKTKEESTKKSDSESKTKDSSEEQKTDSKDTDNKEAKEKSTEKDAKEDSEKNASKEEKNSEKNSEETTGASEATTKAAEEKTTEAAEKKTTEGKDSKEAASKEKAAEETQAEDDKIAVADIGETVTMKVGDTIQLEGTSPDNSFSHQWSITMNYLATMISGKNEATVTIKAKNAGTTTITHTYYYKDNGIKHGTEYYTLKVIDTTTETTDTATAAIYFLATPDGVPGSNETKYWAPESDKSTLYGTIDITDATWQGNKNIVSNVSSHITSWPDNSTAANWVINKGDSNFSYILESIWTSYKKTIEAQLGVENLTKDDVTQITLNPYKISRDNSATTNQYYHIDCTIDVKCAKVFAAKFWVKEPDSNDYKLIDAKNYKTESKVSNTTKATIGSTKEVDGVTYVLDGWYPENSSGGAYGNTKITAWDYSPTEAELADGTVNFYAHYSPTTTSIKLKKLVTGSMGDKQKKFNFTISIQKDSKNVTFKVGSSKETGSATVQLANNEESTLTEIPVGATVTITEDDYSGDNGRYTTTYKIDGSASDGTARVATISNIQAKDDATSAHEIVFTNNKEAIPDTGITVDSLPFITLLALSIAGGIFYLLSRYKKRFI